MLFEPADAFVRESSYMDYIHTHAVSLCVGTFVMSKFLWWAKFSRSIFFIFPPVLCSTQKTMLAAATVIPCRLKWEGGLCVCIISFGESSSETSRSNFFFSETSRSDNFPGLFFRSLFFSAKLWNDGCAFHNRWMFFEADRCYLNQPMHLLVNLYI